MEIRADVASQGWTMLEPVLCDNDRGASRHSRGQRPAYEQLKEILQPGDVLVTWEASRAQRDLAAYVKLRELCAERGVLWRYSGTTHDLSTGEGRFRTGLDALLSENESEKTRERVLRAQRADAAAGKPHGKIAYGYRAERDPATGKVITRVLDEDQAPIVREIARRILDGDAIRAIARDLNARKVPAPGKSTLWNPVSTAQMMKRPTLAGLRSHLGSITPGVWEPIISVEDHRKIVALLSNPARKTHRGVEPRWLLTGIATCGVEGCGRPVVRLKNGGYPAYMCPDKARHVSRTVTKVDEVVEDYVINLMSDKRVAQGLSQPDEVDMQGVLNQIAVLNQRLEECAADVATGAVKPAFGAKVADKITEQIEALEAGLHASIRSPLLAKMAGPDARKIWDAYSVIQRREMLRDFFVVTIMPITKGRRFDPRSVRVRLASE